MSVELTARFARDCEFSSVLRLVAYPANRGARGMRALRRLEVAGSCAIVGSDPRCDLVVDDAHLSPRHAYFQGFGDKVLCLDLGSTLGVDGGAGRCPAAWLDAQHGVQLGDLVFAVVPEPSNSRSGIEPWNPPDFPSAGLMEDRPLMGQALPRVDLLFRSGDVQSGWRVRRPITLLGRAPECVIRLNGRGVSRFHAALVLTPAGLWVVDLLGEIEEGDRDGVRVNERRVRIAPLGSKDILTIGRFRVEPRFSRTELPSTLAARAVPDSNSDSRRLILGTDEIDFPHEFESRLAALTATHHAEIEALRRELEDLRDWVEEFRDQLRKIESATDLRPFSPGRRSGKSKKRFPLQKPLGSATEETTPAERTAGLPEHAPTTAPEPADIYQFRVHATATENSPIR